METTQTIQLKNLPTVTLCAVSSIKIAETIRALQKSMEGIVFAKVLLLTDQNLSPAPEGITVIPIEKLDYNGYSRFMVYRLHEYIDTDFALVVQYDGYVLRPEQWTDEFLQYDYIGAPWPPRTHFTSDGTAVRVGNGGFSLRSKKLLQLPSLLKLPFTDNGTGFFHEDGLLCSYHRKALEAAGIRFASVTVAAAFSHEQDCKESVWRPFGFHGSRAVLPRFLWPIKKILRLCNIKL